MSAVRSSASVNILGNIYVRSERAGQRVMESVTRFIT